MSNRSLKIVTFWLFIFIYIPFLYAYGYKYIFISNVDFPSFYWAADLAFKKHSSPYTVDAFAEAKSILEQWVFPYLYPPPSLLAFYPLTLFSYQTAKSLMLVINHTCILLFIYLFVIKILAANAQTPFRELLIAVSVVYTFAYHPVVDNLNHGQINQIVLLFLCLTWYAVKKNGRSLLIALPLSAAILMKTYPVLFIPLLIIRKKYSAVLWLLVLWSEPQRLDR